MKATSEKLGTVPIGKLLLQQSVPAAIGFLVMSIYQVVDVFFVSRFIGPDAVAAINIVIPIVFLISSFGMAVGIGGASIISRALGSKNRDKAAKSFGNMITMTLGFCLFFVLASFIFNEAILRIFGANDEILELCQSYFFVLMLGIPFLGWAMMSNNVIRAEGKPKTAMLTLVIPAVANIVLDPVFIYYFEMGVEGAAWATTIGYWASGLYTLWFFLRNKSEIPLHLPNFKLDGRLVKEISSIGSVTLVRQASFSLLAVVLNNSLDHYGGTTALSIYGLIRGFTMFVAFPNIGIMQGLIPIVGFNHGAERWDRLKESVRLSTIWTSLTSLSLFLILAIFSEDMVHAFTDDPDLMSRTPRAMIITFMGLPTMGISFIAAAYFQAIGKTYPAMILTLARQGMFMIPLALILPLFMGLDGIWYSLPIGEVLAAIISGIWLWREMKKF